MKTSETEENMAEVVVAVELKTGLFSTVHGAVDAAHTPRQIHKFFALIIERLAPQGQQNGRRGGTRTPDPRIRNPMLYPTELHALNNIQTSDTRTRIKLATNSCQDFPTD
jgi:hypothetical protein